MKAAILLAEEKRKSCSVEVVGLRRQVVACM